MLLRVKLGYVILHICVSNSTDQLQYSASVDKYWLFIFFQTILVASGKAEFLVRVGCIYLLTTCAFIHF